ncbi:MAG: hypothetical protein QXX68_03050 [Candidatus Pacearchaeota archaeon]
MIIWIILIIAALIVLTFLKIEHFSRLVILIVLLTLLVFLFFSFNRMLKSGEISFDSPKSTINSFVTYGKFIETKTTTFLNKTKEGIKSVGDAIKG